MLEHKYIPFDIGRPFRKFRIGDIHFGLLRVGRLLLLQQLPLWGFFLASLQPRMVKA